MKVVNPCPPILHLRTFIMNNLLSKFYQLIIVYKEYLILRIKVSSFKQLKKNSKFQIYIANDDNLAEL